MFNSRIHGKNYITHDAVQKFHQSESCSKQSAPKDIFSSALSHETSWRNQAGLPMLSKYLNICIYFAVILKYIGSINTTNNFTLVVWCKNCSGFES